MKKLNVAIIGVGFGVTSHLPAFKRNKHCKVIALCSRNLKKSNFLKNKNNIKCGNQIEIIIGNFSFVPNKFIK